METQLSFNGIVKVRSLSYYISLLIGSYAPWMYAIAISGICVHAFVYNETLTLGLAALLLVIQACWHGFLGIVVTPVVLYFGNDPTSSPRRQWMQTQMMYNTLAFMITLFPALAIGLLYDKSNKASRDAFDVEFGRQLADVAGTEQAAFVLKKTVSLFIIIIEALVATVTTLLHQRMSTWGMQKPSSGRVN
jgi:hypothetical protein